MASIYHFFNDLLVKRESFYENKPLEEFCFEASFLACKNIGKFPDLAIKLNTQEPSITGGELIELKDSKSYTVASFNSTIPTGRKHINDIIGTSKSNSIIKKQMEDAGDLIDSLPIRDVFYLVRGRSKKNTKVALVHGSFFETLPPQDLIRESFSQVIEERINAENISLNDKVKKAFAKIFSEQSSFSRVREVEKASVKLRFRIMTEIKTEGNILNAKQYSTILDNTLNFVAPCDSSTEQQEVTGKVQKVLAETNFKQLKIFKVKHHLNGHFIVFQIAL